MQKIIALFFAVSISASAQGVPPLPTFKHNEDAYLDAFKHAVNGLDVTNIAIECGKLPPIALVDTLAMEIQQMQWMTVQDFGNEKDSTISFAGFGKFYQATNALLERVDFLRTKRASDKPTMEQCSAIPESFLKSTNEAIGRGL